MPYIQFDLTPTPEDRLIRDQKQQEKVIQLWIFLGCVLGTLAFNNFFRTVWSYLQKRSPTFPNFPQSSADKNPEKQLPGAKPSFWARSTTALVTFFRIISFRLLVPVGFGKRFMLSEIVFVCGYIAALLIWQFEDTRGLSVMFYEDRAAHLAACQIPLIVALAGKNNIISLLTGVSHEKLNVLHRAASRSVLLLLWLHALTRIITGLPPMFDFTHGWVRTGAVGLGALTLTAILSLGPIRTAAFELFFVSHVVLVFIFLIAGFFHVREQGMGHYIWPALMLWALDRVLRGLRIVWNNRLWIYGESKYSTATVELVSNDMIRLSLPCHFSWRPGQHAYVTLPTISKLPFEAHPFTIASIPAQHRIDNVNGSEDNVVVFVIRGRSGMTGRLRRFAARENRSTVTIPALIDGPYGNPPDLLTFSTSVLIAGGSGISYTLPLLLNILRSSSPEKISEIRRVAFIWAIRDAEPLDWISKILTDALGNISPTLSVEFRVYITGSKGLEVPVPIMSPISSGQDGSAASSSSAVNHNPMINIEEKPELPAYTVLKIIYGRPSIRELLHDEISASSGAVSVDVAGPTGLSDSVRIALSSEVASPLSVFSGMPSVTLHVEKFGI